MFLSLEPSLKISVYFSLFWCCWWFLSFLNLLWYEALARVPYENHYVLKISASVLVCSLPSLVRTENTLNVCPVENTCFFGLLWPINKSDSLHQVSRRSSTQTGYVDGTFHNKKGSYSHQMVSADHVEGVWSISDVYLIHILKTDDHNLNYLQQ